MKKVAVKQLANNEIKEACRIELGKNSWLEYLPVEFPIGNRDFEQLWNLHPAHQDKIKLFGKTHCIPRYQQLYGDSLAYRYSNLLIQSAPIKNRIIQSFLDYANAHESDFEYNGVLVNWYESGQHSMGGHSDNEKELIAKAPIYSVSFGGVRTFRVRDKNNRIVLDLPLASCSVLIMGGDMQKHFKHEIPKTRTPVDRRINFTVRAFNHLAFR